MGDSLATLLLGRLPAPLLRIDFRQLQRYCQQGAEIVLPSPTGQFSSRPASPSIIEAELAHRYAMRTSPPVLTILDRYWEAARAALDANDAEAGLSHRAFCRFHGLLSRALLGRVDERSEAVMADCEWALGGGTTRMSSAAFSEWLYDVLEGWTSEATKISLVGLAGELLESVTTRGSGSGGPFGGGRTELRQPEDVEWSGLLRFRDMSAPPTALNWHQARRLVEAAIRWRAYGTMPSPISLFLSRTVPRYLPAIFRYLPLSPAIFLSCTVPRPRYWLHSALGQRPVALSFPRTASAPRLRLASVVASIPSLFGFGFRLVLVALPQTPHVASCLRQPLVSASRAPSLSAYVVLFRAAHTGPIDGFGQRSHAAAPEAAEPTTAAQRSRKRLWRLRAASAARGTRQAVECEAP